jgi:thiamine kinase-like enzyme
MPLYAEDDTGVMLRPYLPERALRSRPPISGVAALLRRLHRLAWPADAAAQGAESDAASARPDTAILDSAERLQTWRRTLGAADPLPRLPQNASAGRGSQRGPQHALDAAIARKAARPSPVCICHNDLLAPNRLQSPDGELLAIDWEYACPGDPFFDLAAVASELDAGERRHLLAAYLERAPSASESQHLHDQLLIYLAIALCWHRAAQSGPDTEAAAQRAFLAACAAAARADAA